MEDIPAPQPQSNQIIQNLQNQINALSQQLNNANQAQRVDVTFRIRQMHARGCFKYKESSSNFVTAITDKLK